MTYLAFETGDETGTPVEIYQLRVGSSEFFFTSGEDRVTIDSITYEPEIISRSSLLHTAEPNEDKITITLPADSPFADIYKGIPVGEASSVTLLRFHREDPDEETVVLFKGNVQLVTFDDDGTEATITSLSILRAKSRQVPRFTYQNPCNHQLYDKRCKLLATDPAFRKNLLITNVTANQITAAGASGFGADFFVAGRAMFLNDNRHVIGQSVDILTLNIPFRVSPINQTIAINAGCRHRFIADCVGKFANGINYGGHPLIPTKNIFDSGFKGGST